MFRSLINPSRGERDKAYNGVRDISANPEGMAMQHTWRIRTLAAPSPNGKDELGDKLRHRRVTKLV